MEETTINEMNIEVPKVKIYIDFDKCIGCGICVEVCPFGLPTKMFNGKYKIDNPELCTECSACKRNCIVEAVFMEEKEGCGCLYDAKSRLSGNPGDSCCS